MARFIPLAFALCCAVARTASAAEPLGLVLAGGGAKGAYEVGVWQALEESGLAANVAAISGTSVGALNAVLFAVRPKAAEELWREHMEEVFTLNTERIGQSIHTALEQTADAIDHHNKVKRKEMEAAARRLGVDIDKLPPGEIAAAEKEARWKGLGNLLLSVALRIGGDVAELSRPDVAREGYIDSSRLASAIDRSLPEEWPDTAPAVYACALEKGSVGKLATWLLNAEPHERRVRMICASAAIPFGFDTVEIDGKIYVDGGWEGMGGDNVPLEPILDKHPEIKTVIVVYLSDEEHLDLERRGKNRKMAEAAGIRLVEVIPEEDIGRGLNGWRGALDASPETARHLIELGKADARKVLQGISGGDLH